MNDSYLPISNIEGSDFEGIESCQRLLELTQATWRVADLAIENEMLKNKVKQIAMDILAQYPNFLDDVAASDFYRNINSQIALLSLAQRLSNSQGINFLVLKSEYKKINRNLPAITSKPVNTIKEEVKTEREVPSTPPVKVNLSVVKNNTVQTTTPQDLNIRQAKIIQIFKKQKTDKIQLKDVIRFFPDLTDRTIRNDLKSLCDKKIVLRIGNYGPSSFYKLAKIPEIDSKNKENLI